MFQESCGLRCKNAVPHHATKRFHLFEARNHRHNTSTVTVDVSELPEDDGLETNEHTEYIRVEKATSSGKNESMNADEERNKTYLGMIREHKIYNTFRTSLRMLLEEETNREYKQQLQDIVESLNEETYTEKLDKIIAILHLVLDPHVTFVDINNDMNSTNSISLFHQKPCLKGIEDCNIMVPKQNLFNGLNNESTYFGRIADELIRYHVLKTFILSSDYDTPILLLPSVQADLNDDEIIVGKNQLDQNFFRALKPANKNKYQRYTSYETQTHNASIEDTPETVEKLGKLNQVVEW